MAMTAPVINITALNTTILCYSETIYRFNGLWEGPDPLIPFISLFLVQLTFSMAVIHFLVLLLKPFNQPSFIAEVLGGILIGPTALGRIESYRKLLFPTNSFKLLEPMAHLSIVYYAFLVGLRMDVKGILRTGPKATRVALTGIFIPFFVGTGLYFIFPEHRGFLFPKNLGCFFWGATLTVTGFSVLSKILENQQILHTEAGKTAAASALISDLSSWALLAFGFSITSSESKFAWSVISTIAFTLLCVYYVRPGLNWIIQKTPEGQGYSEFYICSIVSGMALSGVITDACGTHPMIGAFVFGLIIPNEVLEATIVDKLEDFVIGILMPVYFVVCGLRTNIDAIPEEHILLVLFVIIIVCSVKVVSVLIVTSFADIPVDEAVAVGFLCNAKSIMALIILEAGQIQGALNTNTYSLMVLAVILMTMLVTPAAIYFQPAQNIAPYKRRTIEKAKSEDELRVLACLYNMRNVPSIIQLLRTSNSSQRLPMSVFALQLVELVGRASTMITVHSSRKAGPRNPSHIEAQTDQIITHFDNYELRSEGVGTQVLTARCPYTTMDEDICRVARDKRAALIIIPFHKLQNIDGEMEDIDPSIRSVNEGVLANAPCSVGILIDRGMGESHDHAQNIAVLFFGGPDDREALAYAWRMVEGTNSGLTLVRFISSRDEMEAAGMEASDENQVSLEIDDGREKLLDDDYLTKFKMATENNRSVSIYELVLNDEEETTKTIKSMDDHNHDLYIVGRGRGMMSPLTSGLADWCDCPELGPIGDLLVTSEFESKFSVLIVQQYCKTRDGSMRSSNSTNYTADQELVRRPSATVSEGFDSLSSFRRWDNDSN